MPDEKLFLLNQRNENLIIFYTAEKDSIGIATTNYNNSSVKLLLDGKTIKKYFDSIQINSSDNKLLLQRTLL